MARAQGLIDGLAGKGRYAVVARKTFFYPPTLDLLKRRRNNRSGPQTHGDELSAAERKSRAFPIDQCGQAERFDIDLPAQQQIPRDFGPEPLGQRARRGAFPARRQFQPAGRRLGQFQPAGDCDCNLR